MNQEFGKKLNNFLQSLDLNVEKLKVIAAKEAENYNRLVQYFFDTAYTVIFNESVYLVYKSNVDIRFIEISTTHKNLYGIRIDDENIDFSKVESLKQLVQILRYVQKDSVEFFAVSRELNKPKPTEVFDLLLEGANLSDNETFMFLRSLQDKLK